MAIIQPVIERKLSALLGGEVKFDELKFSLLAGKIEFTGLTIGDFASAARGVAKVAAARAFKGEIIVTSVTIERPVVHLDRLPRRPKSEQSHQPSDEQDKARWTFDIEKLLILDGQLTISSKLTIEKLLVELKRGKEGYTVALLADRLGDHGQLRGQLEYKGKLSLAQLLAIL